MLDIFENYFKWFFFFLWWGVQLHGIGVLVQIVYFKIFNSYCKKLRGRAVGSSSGS